ncbi:MAG: hypothetical protein WD011_01325 [Nitriliruptoraceae bacterium]
MTDHVEVRSGAYADSVSLMQASRRVADVDGVDAALLAMATELNLDVLGGMGFDVPSAGPNDLLVAIRATGDALDAALAEVEAALAATRGGAGDAGFGDGPPPRTVRDGVLAGGTFASVSVPGADATAEALDALEAGVSVMIFSDNVPVDAEVALKRRASERGLLVLGPDAGTTLINGVGYGFANVVRSGPVGIVAASGTGAQQLSCLLDDAGIGVSHVLGVGGRDLQSRVGGASSRTALRALDADPATSHIVLLSKPPDADVAASLRELTATLDTPVTEALLGADADDLATIAARVASDVDATAVAAPAQWEGDPAATAGPFAEVRGLFAGGTLCDEAMIIAHRRLDGVRSNIPIDGAGELTDGLDTPGHVFVDLGEDEFTRGRPHPMIDQSMRVARIHAELERDVSQVLLLDVVLGHAAHPDPAAELVPAIEAAVASSRAVVISLCGSAGDPQDRDGQARRMAEAGAWVFSANAHAAAFAVECVEGGR